MLFKKRLSRFAGQLFFILPWDFSHYLLLFFSGFCLGKCLASRSSFTMKYEAYQELIIGDDFNFVDFISIGRNGNIPKRIAFTPAGFGNFYNLELGDVDERHIMNDRSVSDNGDRDKILATIFNVVDRYTRKYPDRWLFFKGSTNARTRLYRMAIGLNLDELLLTFDIYASNNSRITPFVKNMEIDSFLIIRKSV